MLSQGPLFREGRVGPVGSERNSVGTIIANRPPTQIRVGQDSCTRSHLGCDGQNANVAAPRTRSSACDMVARFCAQSVLCCFASRPAPPFAPPAPLRLGPLCSSVSPATLAESDFSRSSATATRFALKRRTFPHRSMALLSICRRSQSDKLRRRREQVSSKNQAHAR